AAGVSSLESASSAICPALPGRSTAAATTSGPAQAPRPASSAPATGARPEVMRARVLGASRLLHGRTQTSARDYLEVLAECTGTDLIYMDPPYRGVCLSRDSRYAPQISHDAFCEALDGLNKRNCRYIVSYDGRTGDKIHGEPLPASLGLKRFELHAGRSTTATLLGRTDDTYESLYLSPRLHSSIQ
ncbi:MAG: hypothetical protein L0Z62_04950, partial [Gemmataceae bacterium]|nr:hypothetical protein [Gemmataceae bacterium]